MSALAPHVLLSQVEGTVFVLDHTRGTPGKKAEIWHVYENQQQGSRSLQLAMSLKNVFNADKTIGVKCKSLVVSEKKVKVLLSQKQCGAHGCQGKR